MFWEWFRSGKGAILYFNLSCSFCATGKMGKLRSLSSDEILAQLFYAKKIVRLSHDGILDSGKVVLPPVSNIVFMGMGEPA